MSKKILYLMHIPWGWIKQRPHFIAEGLNQKADVKVITTVSFSSKHLLKNKSNVNLIKLIRLPFNRFNVINKINNYFFKLQLKKYYKETDIIWLTSPLFVDWFPKSIFEKKITVYDCMDDFLEFPNIKDNKNKLDFHQASEEFLYNNSSLVITSATYLKSKLFNRYGIRENVYVINNAIKNINPKEIDIELPDLLNSYINNISFKIVYIGTISSWMDFSLLKEILHNIKDSEIFLFGPSEIKLPQIERLNYCGKLEHEQIFKVMNNADVLIMPFIVNELIKSVNPVKLYEYIYSGKPCLAPLYGESQYFEDYVYLYSDASNCIKILKELHNNPQNKCSIQKCREFCENNTWDSRLNQIYSLLGL